MSSGSDCASAEAAAATLWCHETVAESAAAPVVQDGKGVVQKGSAHGRYAYLGQYGTAVEAAVAVARHVAVPVNEQFEWAQCTDCGKWRRLLSESAADLPDVWTCAMSRDALRNSCEAEEEAMDDGEGVAERDGEQEEAKEEEAAVAAAVEEAKEDELTPPAAAPPAAAAATPSPMGSAEWLPERQAQWRQMREAKKQARDDEAEGGASKRPCLHSG